MDESVLAAIARWPNVPHVYGWLSLDRRGRWRLQGSPIDNPHIADFINRNYEHDEHGAWFFQNGPQRVYVKLDGTPWILRVGERQQLITHTGAKVLGVRDALLDDQGNLLLVFELGIGLIEDRDLPALLDAVSDAHGNTVDENTLASVMNGANQPLVLAWDGASIPLAPIQSANIAARYGFIADPQAD